MLAATRHVKYVSLLFVAMLCEADAAPSFAGLWFSFGGVLVSISPSLYSAELTAPFAPVYRCRAGCNPKSRSVYRYTPPPPSQSRCRCRRIERTAQVHTVLSARSGSYDAFGEVRSNTTSNNALGSLICKVRCPASCLHRALPSFADSACAIASSSSAASSSSSASQSPGTPSSSGSTGRRST